MHKPEAVIEKEMQNILMNEYKRIPKSHPEYQT